MPNAGTPNTELGQSILALIEGRKSAPLIASGERPMNPVYVPELSLFPLEDDAEPEREASPEPVDATENFLPALQGETDADADPGAAEEPVASAEVGAPAAPDAAPLLEGFDPSRYLMGSSESWSPPGSDQGSRHQALDEDAAPAIVEEVDAPAYHPKTASGPRDSRAVLDMLHELSSLRNN